VTTVLVLRHGETDWNRERRVQGWAPTPLNDRGREQAAAVGRYLASEHDVDRIVASDLERTRETAVRVLNHADATVEYERAWRERHFGVYQGLLYENLFERFPGLLFGDSEVDTIEYEPEGGESFAAMYERVLTGWEELLAGADPDETILVVAHGGSIYMLLGYIKGLDIASALLEGDQENCALNELEHDHEADETRIVRENVLPWREFADDGVAGESPLG